MGAIIGHRIDYTWVGALRGQRHIQSKNLPKYAPPPWKKMSGFIVYKDQLLQGYLFCEKLR